MSDRIQHASDLILSCCPHVSAYEGTGDAHQLLIETAVDMHERPASAVFPSRYVEHVAYALDAVGRFGFLSPQAAVASVYLATRFEFYFRILSAKLTREGIWVSARAQQEAVTAIGDRRLKRPRVSSVSLAYRVLKLGDGRVSKQFGALDAALYPKPVTLGSGFVVADLGDRAARSSVPVGHGTVPAYEVRPYSLEALVRLTAALSGQNTPEEIRGKSQPAYLDEYFRHGGVKTIVVERGYVDRDYLEDYAAYYVRCFEPYDRYCSRLHFSAPHSTRNNSKILWVSLHRIRQWSGFATPTADSSSSSHCPRPFLAEHV